MFRAVKTFSGKMSMTKGEVRDISDEYISSDLLKAGYIEKVGEEAKKPSAKRRRR